MVELVFIAPDSPRIDAGTIERIGMAIDQEFGGAIICTRIGIIKRVEPAQLDLFRQQQRAGELPELVEISEESMSKAASGKARGTLRGLPGSGFYA